MKHAVSKKWLWMSLFVVFTLTVASAASAQVMKPLADGFPKRAITLVNVDDPGTRDGIYARMFQTAAKGLSPVPILVADEPVAQGGTWMKINELKTRQGALEGYYPVVIAAFGVVTDLQVEPATKDINAKLTDLKMVLVTEQICYIFIQKKNAPWGKKFDDFLKYAKAHQGELKYVSYEVGSGHDIAMEWIMAKYGVKVKKIPQGTQQECASAVGAGQADFSMLGADVALTNWQAGRVDVTFILGDTVPAPWNKDPSVTAGKAMGLPSFVGTIMGLGVNSQVPQTHIDWMYKLFKAVSEKPEFKKRWEGMIPGNVPKPMTGPEADKMNAEILKAMDKPIRDVGLHIDQQKKK
jgi:tripartite-type tricarboxylate transporter receptor subunit TctC